MPEFRARATDWARHHYLLIATIGGVLMTFQPLVYDAHHARWVAIPFIPAVFGWIWAFTEAERHPNRMCDRCIHGYVAGAEEAAARRTWMLRLFHFVVDHPKPLGAAVVAVLVASFLVPAVYAIPFGAVIFGASIALLASMKAHHRYVRWCPWCRDDGEDDREDVPDPVEREKV